jgi:hypothetical protein
MDLLKLVDVVRGLPLAAAWYEVRLAAVGADAGTEGAGVDSCHHQPQHDKQSARCVLERGTGR